jgi:pterin-4a-carbinolamine dehydratase
MRRASKRLIRLSLDAMAEPRGNRHFFIKPWWRETTVSLGNTGYTATVTKTSNVSGKILRREFSSTISLQDKISRPDPLARRPNRICDPYGLGGQPLSHGAASQQLQILNDGWRLVGPDSMDHEIDRDSPPSTLVREFCHADFLTAARFVKTIAAVAHVNNHFPTISIERRLLSQEAAWQVVTTVSCCTPTLKGLSHTDFYIAMVRKSERGRFLHAIDGVESNFDSMYHFCL